MDEPVAKRARLSMEDVLIELDNDDDEPMMPGSDDKFKDILCTEKERDEWGGIDRDNYPSDNYDLSPTIISSAGDVMPSSYSSTLAACQTNTHSGSKNKYTQWI